MLGESKLTLVLQNYVARAAFAGLFIMLSSCSDQSSGPTMKEANDDRAGEIATATQNFNEWLDSEYATELDFRPLTKTIQGIKSDYGNLDDVSEQALDRQLAWKGDSVARMQSEFDRSELDAQGQLSWDLWEYQLEIAELNLPFRRHSYIFGRNGPQSRLPNRLINSHRVDSVSDMEAYISRLQQSQRYMAQYLERAKLSAADGIRAPFFDYEQAISEINRITTGVPFSEAGSSALWTDVSEKISALQSVGVIDEVEAARLKSQATDALLHYFKPAFDEVLAWLEADKINTTELAQGVSSLPNGDEYYKVRLQTMTTLPMGAEAIHELGISEVARIHQEMEGIKRVVGFEGSLQDFFGFLREDDRFYFETNEQGRADYLEMAEVHLAEMYTKLPDYFGILPKAGLEVKRVEAFRETAGGAAHYRRGTKDGSRPGTFYVHLADMRAVAVNRLENLSYHEGVPGHHMQRSIQTELENIPDFRTNGGYTAYTEGWGLYAELLGKEMGGYKDPFSDMGRLSGELWRAVRLVVDTGIHAKNWTQADAVDYALANSPRPDSSVRSEVRRYFNNPGQATAYKIGMLKIIEYRKKAEAQLGEKFDIKGFHDTVLGSGPVPMRALEALVDRWIAELRM
ncbi:MAG: hypothetical protein ACI87Q_002391 [Pseudohongiellaceae bacterium]|jgi:uncharacterized protein (DUF885 family)